MMKILLKFLKKLPAKWLIGVIALIWVLGVGLRLFSIITCIILTVAVIAVWAVYALIKWSRTRGEGLEAERVPELASVEERLVNAVRSARGSPWYLLIGPSGSGKTVMLRRSNLDFSYIDSSQKKPPTQGIEETRSCDLFYTKDGIILDTTGRYITFGSEAKNQTEWLGLLSLLKKHRRKRPIEGLIVAIDVVRLAQADDYQMEEEAKNIRERIAEAISNLGITFPVYLIFTKCDLVYGFSQFFGDLSVAERTQIWGATLPGDQQERAEVVFKEESSRLFHSLSERRLSRLTSGKANERGAIYIFPLEFNAAYQKLAHFVGLLFPAVAQEKPMFRGFYFTSAMQDEGPPIDFVMRRVEESLDRKPAPLFEGTGGRGEARSYFVKDIFYKIIFFDRGLGRSTATEGRRNTLRRLVFCAAAAVIFGILGIMFAVAFNHSKQLMTDVRRESASVNAIRSEPMTVDKLERFEKLRSSIVRLEGFSLFSFPWLSQRSEVAAIARKFYLTEKYGSGNGWSTNLKRDVEIPVKVFKSEVDTLKPIEEVEIKAVVGGQEHKALTDEEGTATLKVSVEDGKADVTLSIDHEEPGFEPQGVQSYQIQPGEQVTQAIRFVFSKLGRVIVVHCVDQGGEDLAGVPVSIIEQTEEMKEYGPETSNEQGVAQLRLEAPEGTVLLVYYGDSSNNLPADEPDTVTIQAGKSRYLVEKELPRKHEITVVAYSKDEEGANQQPNAGVSVSIGGTKLGSTGNDGHLIGSLGSVPTRQNVVADPRPVEVMVERTTSGYTIKLEYIRRRSVPPGQTTKEEPEPEPLPVIELAKAISGVEAWIYVQEGENDLFNSADVSRRMDFESDGRRIRLVRVDATEDGAKNLKLSKEAEGHQLLLCHPDYWPQKAQKSGQPIQMIGIKQKRSFNDFDREQRDGAEHYHQLAQRNHSQGNLQEAIRYYRNAIRLAPRLKHYLELAWAYYENDQPEAAARQIKAGLELELVDDPEADEDFLKQQMRELMDLLP